MTGFTPAWSLLGGLLVGLASAVLLGGARRPAGVSGIAAGLLPFGAVPGRPDDRGWRAAFIAGLVAGGLLLRWWMPASLGVAVLSPGGMALAGLLVGFGTRVGGGCTSGHGICGLARLSRRSLVAVLVFVATAMITVAVVRAQGGSP
jgi:uncharacterized protein